MKALLRRVDEPTVHVIVPSPPPKRFYLPIGNTDDIAYVVHTYELAGVQDGAAHYGYTKTTPV